MTKLVALFLLMAFARTVSSQTNETLAYYVGDSILKIMPGYPQIVDSVNTLNQQRHNAVNQMDSAISSKRVKLRIDSASLSPEIYAIRKKEIQTEDSSLFAYITNAGLKDYKAVELLVSPLKKQIDDAAQIVAKAQGYSVAYEKKAAFKMNKKNASKYTLVDITALVIAELKIPAPVNTK